MSEPALRVDSPRGDAQAAAVLSSPSGWFGAAGTAAEVGTRHSRRVALLKRVLPVIGVALLLLVAIWPRLAPLWDRMRVALPAIDLRHAKELQMVNPRYAGVDRTGRPFVVTAASGRQVPDRQDLMSLRAPRADVKTQGGADIVITAATGVYQSQSQMLDLFQEVTLVHQNGTKFRHQLRPDRRRRQHRQRQRTGRGARALRRYQGAGFRNPRQGRHDPVHRPLGPAAEAGEAGPGEERSGCVAGSGRHRRGARPSRGQAGARRGEGETGGARPAQSQRRAGGRASASPPHPPSLSRRKVECGSMFLSVFNNSSLNCRIEVPAEAGTHRLASATAEKWIPAGAGIARIAGGVFFAAGACARRECADRRAGRGQRPAAANPGRFRHRVAAGPEAIHRPRQRRRDPRHQRGAGRHADRALPRCQERHMQAPTPAATPRFTGSWPRAASR